MDIGSQFDDEYFEKPKVKSDEVAEGSGAKICFPKWYCDEDLVTKDEGEILNCMRYQADRFYYKKNYAKASVIYEEYLKRMPSSNTQGQRECMENLSRSLLHQGRPDEAIEWALKMHHTSNNQDQKNTSWNLLATVCHRLGKYDVELEALHHYMEDHKCHPDVWIRLAYCYAGLFKIDLPTNSIKHRANSEVPCCAFNSRLLNSIHYVPPKDESQCTDSSTNTDVLCNCELGVKQDEQSTGTTVKQDEPSTETAIKQDEPSTETAIKQDEPSTETTVKQDEPSTETTVKQDEPSTETAEKCDVCHIGVQMVSACLIRTSLLIPGVDKNDLSYEKLEQMKVEIDTCLKFMKVEEMFIEEASKELNSNFFAGLKDPMGETMSDPSCSSKTEVKSSTEDSSACGIQS